VAWHGDPAIDWPATAVRLGLLDEGETSPTKRTGAIVDAMRHYMKEVDVGCLEVRPGREIQWFEVRALTERQRLDLRTDALCHCGSAGSAARFAVEDRMHLLVFQAVVSPPPIGMTDDVREAVGDLALRLSQSSVSAEPGDDVGKLRAP